MHIPGIARWFIVQIRLDPSRSCSITSRFTAGPGIQTILSARSSFLRPYAHTAQRSRSIQCQLVSCDDAVFIDQHRRPVPGTITSSSLYGSTAKVRYLKRSFALNGFASDLNESARPMIQSYLFRTTRPRQLEGRKSTSSRMRRSVMDAATYIPSGIRDGALGHSLRLIGCSASQTLVLPSSSAQLSTAPPQTANFHRPNISSPLIVLLCLCSFPALGNCCRPWRLR